MLDRGVLDEDGVAVFTERLPEADFHDLRIDLRTLPFFSEMGTCANCGEVDGDGVVEGKGGNAGDGWRESRGGVRAGTRELRGSCMNCMLGIEAFRLAFG